MKKLFTLLFILSCFFGISVANTTTYTMVTADYQALVDYTNAQGLNTSAYSTNTDDYFGASAYYSNFDFRDGKWNNKSTFTSWEKAVQTAVATVILPANFKSATTTDTLDVYFKRYDGTATVIDYFKYICTKASPDPTFAAYESTAGSYKAEILTFTLTEQVSAATIDVSGNTIAITVASGTNVTALKPVITVSEGATITPESGTAVDFTQPVTYTVTSQNKTDKKVWTVTVTVMAEAFTSIHDIQYVADPATSDVSPFKGKIVTVQGLVTGFATFSSYNKYYIQEDGNPWSGVYVYDSKTSLIMSMGDKVKVTGSIDEYYNVTELVATKAEIISSRNTLPAPIVTNELTESLEGVLVTVEGLTLATDEDATDYASALYLIGTKGDKTYKINSELFKAFTPEAGKSYNVTGVVAFLRNYYRICPRSANDFVVRTSASKIQVNEQLSVYPIPASQSITLRGANGNEVEISNLAGQLVKRTSLNGNRLNVSDLSDGVYLLKNDNRTVRFVKYDE